MPRILHSFAAFKHGASACLALTKIVSLLSLTRSNFQWRLRLDSRVTPRLLLSRCGTGAIAWSVADAKRPARRLCRCLFPTATVKQSHQTWSTGSSTISAWKVASAVTTGSGVPYLLNPMCTSAFGKVTSPDTVKTSIVEPGGQLRASIVARARMSARVTLQLCVPRATRVSP